MQSLQAEDSSEMSIIKIYSIEYKQREHQTKGPKGVKSISEK